MKLSGYNTDENFQATKRVALYLKKPFSVATRKQLIFFCCKFRNSCWKRANYETVQCVNVS